MDSLNRRSELLKVRKKMLERTTPEQREAETKKLIEAMDNFGKLNFPHAPRRWEEEEKHNES